MADLRVLDITPSLAVVTADDGEIVVVEQPPTQPIILSSGLGIQGPPGPAGAAGSSYEHTQSSAALSWSVAHNLGFKPTVSVRTTGGVEVEAEIVHLSNNVTEIFFVSALAGTARFN